VADESGDVDVLGEPLVGAECVLKVGGAGHGRNRPSAGPAPRHRNFSVFGSHTTQTHRVGMPQGRGPLWPRSGRTQLPPPRQPKPSAAFAIRGYHRHVLVVSRPDPPWHPTSEIDLAVEGVGGRDRAVPVILVGECQTLSGGLWEWIHLPRSVLG